MYKTGRKITFLTIAMAFFFLSSCKEEERKAKYVVKNEIVMPESWYIDLPKEKKIEIKDTIKTLGTITINIKLYEGIIGNLKVDVISA